MTRALTSRVGQAARVAKGARRFRPGVEPMESRQMLAGGLAQAAAAASTPVPASSISRNRAYVVSLNHTLDRGALTEAQVTSLTRMLDRGASTKAVVNRILSLPVTLRTQVGTQYARLLGRAPSAREMAAGVKLLRAGRDQRAVSIAILSSAPFYASAGGTDAAYVDAVYRRLLNRAPSDGEAATAGGMLATGKSRRSFANSVVFSTPALSDLATRILSFTPDGKAPSATDQAAALRTLQRPNGVRTLTARTLASATYYAAASAPVAGIAAPTAPGDGAPNPTLPLGKQFDLGTRWTNLSGAPSATVGVVIDTASDGSIWEAFFNPNAAGLSSVQVATAEGVLTSSFAEVAGQVGSITALSPTVAWAVSSDGTFQITYENNQYQVTSVPALPGGDTLVSVSAVSSEAVLGVGRSGTAYNFVNGGWGPYQFEVADFTAVSVGSVSNIWLLRTDAAGLPQPVLLLDNPDVQLFDDFDDKGGVTQLSATPDGAAWAVAGNGSLYLWTPETGAWHAASAQTPPGTLTAISGISRYRMNAFLGNASLGGQSVTSLALLSYGASDQPATGFPAMNAGQAAAYTVISQRILGSTSPDASIRADYDNVTFQGDFDTWAIAIAGYANDPAPAGISQADWASMANQLAQETRNLNFVVTLFGNLSAFVSSVTTASSKLLTDAAKLVQLSDDQQNSAIAVIFEDLITAVVSGIAAVPTGGGAIVAAVVASGFNSAVSGLTNQPNPDYSSAINTTVIQLGDQLANGFFLGADTANAGYEDAIIRDYGRFTAVGQAVSDGLLDWDDSQNQKFVDQAVNGFNRYFFRTLMPIRFDIVAYNAGFDDYIYDYLPPYDVYFISSNFDPYMPGYLFSGNFRFIQDRSGNDDPRILHGALPTTQLLNAIYQTGVTQADLFTGANGWLQVVV